MANNRFGRKGVFECHVCHSKTRDCGFGNAEVELCPFCYHEAELENSLSDGCIDKKEFEIRLAKLKKKYKRQ